VQYVGKHHFGEVERTPVVQKSERTNHSLPAMPVATGAAVSTGPEPQAGWSWEANAKIAVEHSIDQFVLEFIEFPYLHRVEADAHCELFRILTAHKIFSRTYRHEDLRGIDCSDSQLQ